MMQYTVLPFFAVFITDTIVNPFAVVPTFNILKQSHVG